MGILDKKYKGADGNGRVTSVYYVSPQGEKIISFQKLAEAS